MDGDGKYYHQQNRKAGGLSPNDNDNDPDPNDPNWLALLIIGIGLIGFCVAVWWFFKHVYNHTN